MSDSSSPQIRSLYDAAEALLALMPAQTSVAGLYESTALVTLAATLRRALALLESSVRAQPPAGEASVPVPPTPNLTAREVEILRLLGVGLTADAIARQLRISGRTVRKHLENVYRKLDCHDRMLAVERARQLGILGTTSGVPQRTA
jgi:DNA-binding NarL/FixJ family response regulator